MFKFSLIVYHGQEQPKKMKKFLSFVLVLALTSTMYADFKIMGGLSLSKYLVSGDDSAEWNNKAGFASGLGFEKNLNPLMLIEFDVFYFQKGSKAKAVDSSLLTYKLNVLSIPVLFRSKLLYDSSPYAVAGVEFSFITAHQIELGDLEPIDIKDSTSSFDFGIVLGGGFELKLQERLFLFIEGRYHRGMRNIVIDPSGSQNWKTNAFLIILGIRS